jgi:hypothetical protein
MVASAAQGVLSLGLANYCKLVWLGRTHS